MHLHAKNIPRGLKVIGFHKLNTNGQARSTRQEFLWLDIVNKCMYLHTKLYCFISFLSRDLRTFSCFFFLLSGALETFLLMRSTH